MQTKYVDLFSFDPVIMGDAKCAETNEKSIFRFLLFNYREYSSKIGVMTPQK